MAIAPITEAQVMGIPGMPQGNRKSGSAKEAGSDFMQAFTNAQSSCMSDLQAAGAAKTEGTGAQQGKDSDTTGDPNRAKSQEGIRKNESQKTQQPEKAAKTEDTNAAEKVSSEEEITEEVEVSAEAQQLFAEIAQLLNISPEELGAALEEMGVDASALLDPGTMNQLVANIAAEGDLSALVTDSNLSELAKELNALVGEMVGQLEAENVQADPEALKNAFADALMRAAEEAQVTEEVVNTAELEQTGTQDGNENTQDEIADKRRQRTERFEERAADAMAQMNAETADANVADIADDLRTQTEQLRYTTNPQEIMDQVLEQIKTQVKEDMTSLDMVLHPASLGHVALNLTSRDGAVTAQLTAQNESVRAALESQIQILKENLEQAGVKIEAVEVTVSSHAFEQNLEQGNDQESDAQMQERERLRRATHKINLGDAQGDGIEGIDDLGEAEAVNVAMMQADGRRLDYRT